MYFLLGLVQDTSVEGSSSISLMKLFYQDRMGSINWRVHVVWQSVVRDPFLDILREFLVHLCPVKRSSVLITSEKVWLLTCCFWCSTYEIQVILEPSWHHVYFRGSCDFRSPSVAKKWFPSGEITWPRNFTLLKEKQTFVRICFEASFPEKGMTHFDKSKHLVSVFGLRYRIVDVSFCLFFSSLRETV